MAEEKFYTSKNDIVFKCVFLDENNTYLLQEFLSRLLKRKVNNIIFKREYQHKDYVREKTRILDFLADVDGEMIHIELNSTYQKYYNVRNFSYFATVYNRHIKSGDDYDLTTKFLHIDLSYDLQDNNDEYRTYFIIDRNGNKYIENFEIIEYNMNRFKKYYDEKDKEKLKEYSFLIMLDLEKEDLNTFAKGDNFMEKFEEKVNEVNKDPEFQSFMTAEEDYQKCLNTDRKIARKEGFAEGHAEGHAEGLAEGRVKGREEGRFEGHQEGMAEGILKSAKKFIESGMSKEEVAKILGIDVKQIDNK